jgi:hypothetical protein
MGPPPGRDTAVALRFALLSRRRWVVAGTAALVAAQLFWLFPLDQFFLELGPGGPAARAIELKAMNINSEFGGVGTDHAAIVATLAVPGSASGTAGRHFHVKMSATYLPWVRSTSSIHAAASAAEAPVASRYISAHVSRTCGAMYLPSPQT